MGFLKGHWIYSKVVQLTSSDVTSSECSSVTMAENCTIFRIFTDLQTWVRSCSRLFTSLGWFPISFLQYLWP